MHGLTVGSAEGQARKILDFNDVVAGVEEPAVLKLYTTRRIDEHYRRIAAATGGHFESAARGAVDRLVAAIESYRPPIVGEASESDRRPLAPLLLSASSSPS